MAERWNVVIFLFLGAMLSSQVNRAHADTVARTSSESTATIDFKGVSDGAFVDYKEHGYGVRARTSAWVGDTSFGDPAPFIEFETPGETKSTQSVIVTHGGQGFTFQSIAIYSSITTIPYKFRGSLNGLAKYVVTGTVPNTFGAFATATNPDAATTIDRLEISVTKSVDMLFQPGRYRQYRRGICRSFVA